MSKTNVYILAISIMCLCWGCKPSASSIDSPTIVKTEKLSSRVGETSIEYPARIKAAEEVNLAFKVSGTLKNIHVKNGSKVHKGDLVASLDSRDYDLLLQATQAEYLSIRSEAERIISLYHDSVTTALEYDKARYGLKQITAKYENVRHQVEDTRLYAPFDGYVKHTIYDPPTVVGAGMPVMTLISSSRPEIEINIPYSTYTRLKEITRYTAVWEGIATPIHLELINIVPAANASQLYTARLSLPYEIKNTPPIGSSATVNITFSNQSSSFIKIPASAIWYDGKTPCVWIYSPHNSTVQKHTIVVQSLHTDGSALISAGLVGDEEIVTAGVHSLHNGQKVKPMETPSSTNTGKLL